MSFSFLESVDVIKRFSFKMNKLRIHPVFALFRAVAAWPTSGESRRSLQSYRRYAWQKRHCAGLGRSQRSETLASVAAASHPSPTNANSHASLALTPATLRCTGQWEGGAGAAARVVCSTGSLGLSAFSKAPMRAFVHFFVELFNWVPMLTCINDLSAVF